MVLDVTEIDPRLAVDAWQLLPSELHRDFFHGDEDSLQPTELPPKGEDVPDLIAVEEALGGFRLHLEHLFADVIDQRRIAVDDIIEHRVEQVIGAVHEKHRRLFELLAKCGVSPLRAMPDGDDMALSDKDGGFAIFDDFAVEARG